MRLKFIILLLINSISFAESSIVKCDSALQACLQLNVDLTDQTNLLTKELALRTMQRDDTIKQLSDMSSPFLPTPIWFLLGSMVGGMTILILQRNH